MKLISRALDKTIRHFNIDRKHVKVNALKRTFADNYYDHFLYSIMGIKEGYFVELGANDGIRQSYTAFLEFYFGWGGVLIEPHLETFMQCVKNRSEHNRFSNSACVSFTYKEEYVELFFADLMTVSTQIENDGNVHRHIDDAQNNLPESSRFGTFKASAKTLNAILTQSESPQLMDLLVLDVEGAELEVLKGLDHDYYRFRWMLIESRNISFTTAYLLEKNYVYSNQISPRDYLFRGLKCQ